MSLGLSFYTSEKTLRAAFEGFGQLVQGNEWSNIYSAIYEMNELYF